MNSKWSHSTFVIAILIAIVIYCIPSSVYAQSKSKKVKLNRTTLIFNDSELKVKGVLYQLNNNSISLSSTFDIAAYLSGDIKLDEYPITSIDKIKIYSPKKMKRSILIGAAIGFLGGIIYSAKDGILMYIPEGLVPVGIGTIVGAGIGAAMGTIKINIHIGGDANTYYTKNKKLKKYVFTP